MTTASRAAAPGALNDLCLYTVPEVMAMLHMSRSVIFDELRDRRLKSLQRGRSRRFTADHIREYIALLEHESADQSEAA
jgi:predicted DNA-binding transcriptional regulator AlpA